MSAETFQQLAEAKAAIERRKSGVSPEITRIVVTGHPIRGLGNASPYYDLEPFQFYPFYFRVLRERGTGEEGQSVTMGNIDAVASRGKAVPVYPINSISGIAGSYGVRGDIEDDWGFRQIESLVGVEDVEKLLRLQELIYPETIIKGAPDGLFKKLEDHIKQVMIDYGPDTLEYSVAEECLDSVEAGHRWKLNHFRARVSDVNIGGPTGINEIESEWRREISVDLPQELQASGMLPMDKVNAGQQDNLLEKLVEKLTKSQDIEALVESRASEIAKKAVEEVLAAQASAKKK